MYVGLTSAQLAGVIAASVIGACVTGVAFVVVGKHVLDRELDEYRFRRELKRVAAAERFEGPRDVVVERTSRAFAIDGELRREATAAELEQYSAAATEARDRGRARTAVWN